ncbi:MAG: hypothetical protein ABWZ56_04945 [Flavobacterium sp.]
MKLILGTFITVEPTLLTYNHKKRRSFDGPPIVDFDLQLPTHTSQYG